MDQPIKLVIAHLPGLNLSIYFKESFNEVKSWSVNKNYYQMMKGSIIDDRMLYWCCFRKMSWLESTLGQV